MAPGFVFTPLTVNGSLIFVPALLQTGIINRLLFFHCPDISARVRLCIAEMSDPVLISPLILHRYNESTLSRMRSLYVTPLQGNFSARMQYLQNELDAAPSASAKKKLQKEMDLLGKKQAELAAFDNQLRLLADRKIALDLDDGVKFNYAKFGTLLAETKAVTGQK